MNNYKFYYRFKATGIDFTSEKEIKKYNKELTSLDCLTEQFNKLSTAYNNALKERADIIINVLPEISGVAEISVYHNINFKLFSRQVKNQCFSFCISKYDADDKIYLFFYNTEDFNEVKNIISDFVEKQTVPDLKGWQSHFIG